jgi:hypothetical protein
VNFNILLKQDGRIPGGKVVFSGKIRYTKDSETGVCFGVAEVKE